MADLLATPSQLRDYARRHTLTAMRTVVDLCQNAKKDSTRLAAAKELLDRGWGRSVQAITYDTADGAGLLTLLQDAYGNAQTTLNVPQMIERVIPEDLMEEEEEPVPVRRRPKLNNE